MTQADSNPEGVTRHLVPRVLLHDLRTPLNHIIGYAEMLIENAQDKGQDAFIPDLQVIRSSGQQLLTLIDDNLGPIREAEAVGAEPPIRAASPSVGAASAPQSQQDISGAADGYGHLLVVDDNEANRDVLSRRLERQGYSVATAEDGLKALEILAAETFDLVLLDITMPEMDGYEVLRRLKTDYRLAHIPVIVISALNELDSVARCIEMGAEDYLPKPFNPTVLKARIGACLEKKRAHDRETQLYEQLQQNYKRLQELETLRDDLTHMIIHDLRTPLTSVITGMQTLDVVGELNPDQRMAMEIAVSGGETLLGMINDLLDVEKLESEAMQLDCVLLSAGELVSSAVSQVASLAEFNQLQIVQKIDDDLPAVQGDEDKLLRTLVNLIGNAIKFTPSGGTVTVAVGRGKDGRSLLFSVSDTGEGIPADAFGRIFEKFGQVESRQGGRKMSTGLGLTFCKLAVEAHGGQIDVESLPGQGSTFCFDIPFEQPVMAGGAVAL